MSRCHAELIERCIPGAREHLHSQLQISSISSRNDQSSWQLQRIRLALVRQLCCPLKSPFRNAAADADETRVCVAGALCRPIRSRRRVETVSGAPAHSQMKDSQIPERYRLAVESANRE